MIPKDQIFIASSIASLLEHSQNLPSRNKLLSATGDQKKGTVMTFTNPPVNKYILTSVNSKEEIESKNAGQLGEIHEPNSSVQSLSLRRPQISYANKSNEKII